MFTCLISLGTFAQKGNLSGLVTDDANSEPVVGAYVYISDEFRAKTDEDGMYEIKNIPYGDYTIRLTMALFDTVKKRVSIDESEVVKNIVFSETKTFDEVEVIGNLAEDRKTPVAVTRIPTRKLNEELGSQDLPMILNSTPGVHATQTGGGDGDARITIRGFDQRNVGVMIDGVPVNDMENGWVYWSNWFGLDAITQTIQVQRGLGATKLAMPSVGGTMNILTQGTGGKRKIKVRQEYGTGQFLRTSLSYNSGRLKNGWGVLFSGSYKQGNGWVDQANTQGAFYYLKVQKTVGNHLISLSGFGAPQNHGQRSFQQPVDYWDKDYALGFSGTGEDGRYDTTNAENYGIQYNQHWGYYTDSATGKTTVKNERLNYYHKPQITLKDFWKVNKKLSWSNLAYVSIGRGGGQRIYNSGSIIRDENNQIAWNEIEYANQYKTLFGTTVSTADAAYHPTQLKSSQVLTASVNNHFWVGLLSQFDYELNEFWDISGGIDYRYYKGEHYTELVDLLGGDYWVNNANDNSGNPMKVEGDKVGWQPYHNHRDGLVQWMGGFGQAEYSKGRWTAFANFSTTVNGYKGIDYFEKKELRDGDTTIYVGANDTIMYNGTTYTNDHPDLVFNQTDWKYVPGFTFKSGANLNVTEKSNVFVNVGILSRTPQYSNVVDNNTNSFFLEILNEKIMAFEAGYGYRSRKLSLNVNGYYTYWLNKPFPFGISIPDPQDPTEFVRVNVNGMDALHMGAEVDAVYRISKDLSLEGMVSIGDWTWRSSETIDVLGTEVEFDAKGVHVGNAAQSTYALSSRYQFVKNGYVKLKYTFFSRCYSDFEPFSLTGENGGRESWQMPDYGLMSLHAGYTVKFSKSALVFRGNVFNLLNTKYISDARNNGAGQAFDAESAQVFFGQGLRFNVSVGFEF